MSRVIPLPHVDVALRTMKYQDVKAACIKLGMPFDSVIKADWHGLKSYYAIHYGETEYTEKLGEFETHLSTALTDMGYEKDDPLVKFKQFTGNPEEEVSTLPEEASTPAASVPKKKRKGKRERNEFGGFKGTKKAYVFEGVKKGASIEKVLKKTLEKFPDAKEKSIRIWFKKATRELNE